MLVTLDLDQWKRGLLPQRTTSLSGCQQRSWVTTQQPCNHMKVCFQRRPQTPHPPPSIRSSVHPSVGAPSRPPSRHDSRLRRTMAVGGRLRRFNFPTCYRGHAGHFSKLLQLPPSSASKPPQICVSAAPQPPAEIFARPPAGPRMTSHPPPPLPKSGWSSNLGLMGREELKTRQLQWTEEGEEEKIEILCFCVGLAFREGGYVGGCEWGIRG